MSRIWMGAGNALATLFGAGIGAAIGSAMARKRSSNSALNGAFLGAGLAATAWGFATSSDSDQVPTSQAQPQLPQVNTIVSLGQSVTVPVGSRVEVALPPYAVLWASPGVTTNNSAVLASDGTTTNGYFAMSPGTALLSGTTSDGKTGSVRVDVVPRTS